MKVALCSDLHLEFAPLVIKNTNGADILVLAGDIMIANDLQDFPEGYVHPSWGDNVPTRAEKAQMYRDFLAMCSREFKHVLFVAGNHEFYNGRWEQTLVTLRTECEKFNNVHFLENNVFVYGDVTFVGGTLWTDLNGGDPITKHVVGSSMNDYRIIRVESRDHGRLRPDDSLNRHIATKRFIEQTVDKNPDSKFFVIGHMAPSKLSTHPRYADDVHMNGGYSSDLSEFILNRPQIKNWVHGHTHHPFDYTIGECRITANPRGYVGFERGSQEDEPYYPLVIEV